MLVKKNKDQCGYTPIEILLLLIVVLLVGFVAWYVVNAKNKADSSYNNSSKLQPVSAPVCATAKDPSTKIDYQQCSIIVVFKTSVDQTTAEQTLKETGLKYKLISSHGTNLMYEVTVPKGQEKSYINIFEQKSTVDFSQLNSVSQAT